MGSVARVTSAAEGLPRRRFTVAEVEAMVAAAVMEEDERVELIGGELVPMSPKGNHHEVVKTALLADGIVYPNAKPTLFLQQLSALARTPILNPTSSSIPARLASAALPPTTCCSWSRSRTPRCAATPAARRRSTQAPAFANFGSLTRFD